MNAVWLIFFIYFVFTSKKNETSEFKSLKEQETVTYEINLDDLQDILSESTVQSDDKNDQVCKISPELNEKYQEIFEYIAICYGFELPFEIYETICVESGCDMRKIAVILGHAIHNTSGFTQMVAQSQEDTEDRYISRGIFQITLECNYKCLGEPFVSNPEELGKLSLKSVKSSIEFFKKIVPEDALDDLFDSLYFLNPVEVQDENYKDKEFDEILEARENTYRNICDCLGIERKYKCEYLNCKKFTFMKGKDL